MFDKKFQDHFFRFGEVNLLIIVFQGKAFCIIFITAGKNYALFMCLQHRNFQRRSDTKFQFKHIERLLYIVATPGFIALFQVIHLGHRCDKKRRYMDVALFQLPEKLQSVCSRYVDVEKKQVVAVFKDGIHRPITVTVIVNGVAFVFQDLLDGFS